MRVASLFRQRNELGLIRHWTETARFPVRLRFLDARLAGGNEIPPDMARAFHCGAAEEHHACLAYRLDGDPVAGAEDQHLRCCEFVTGDIDLAFDEIDGAFL